MFLVAIGIFELGSLICGVAPTSVALIVGRAIAGVGSAGVFSGAYLLVATSVPLAKRPTFTGLIGGMYGIASAVGPLLGGAFTDKVTWRWCFYINLLIGGVAVAVMLFFFKPIPQPGGTISLTWKERIEQFDILGTVVFIPDVVCLLIALQWGGSTYPWSNGRIIALRRLRCIHPNLHRHPILETQTRNFQSAHAQETQRVGRGLFYLLHGFRFLCDHLLPPHLVPGREGRQAYESGIRNIPILLSVVVGTILSDALVTNIGYYTPFMLASSVLTSIGAGLLTTLEVDTGSPKWIGYQVICGFGIGLGLQLPLVATQTVLDMSEIPSATALCIFMQLFGAAALGESVP